MDEKARDVMHDYIRLISHHAKQKQLSYEIKLNLGITKKLMELNESGELGEIFTEEERWMIMKMLEYYRDTNIKPRCIEDDIFTEEIAQKYEIE